MGLAPPGRIPANPGCVTRIMNQIRLLAPLACAAILAACSRPSTEPTPASARAPSTAKAPPPIAGVERGWDEAARTNLEERAPEEYPGLHNVFRLSDDIVSGSEPHGEEAFAAARRRWASRRSCRSTARCPTPALAAQYGMRYVHVPIQLHAASPTTSCSQIAKTFRELDGPFYVHCFHGKHRGPAAAGGRSRSCSTARRASRRSPRCASGAAPPRSTRGSILTIADGRCRRRRDRRVRVGLPRRAALRRASARRWSRSRAPSTISSRSQANGWQPDPEHPDLDAVERGDAGRPGPRGRPRTRRDRIPPGGLPHVARRLERARREAGRRSATLPDGDAQAGDEATRSYRLLKKTCDACHASYRDQ